MGATRERGMRNGGSFAWVIALVCAAACGGSDGDDPAADGGSGGSDASLPPTCGTNGAAQVNGTVAGWTVEPVTAWFRSPFLSGAVLVIDERATTCFTENDTPMGAGQNLVLAFCDAAVTPGTYTVLSEQDFPWDSSCPGQRIAGSVTEDGVSGYEEDSVTGTVEIDSMEGGCVTGSFDVTFTDSNQFTGTFNAVACAP